MCFSSSASFAASGMLFCMGYFTMTQIHKKKYAMFAMIPLLFALQQAAEGVVWLTMYSERYQMLNRAAAYLFLLFALTIWPSWIPISLWLFEDDRKRKRLLSILSLIGLLISCYTFFILAWYPINVQIFNCSIWYSIGVMSLLSIGIDLFIYALTVIGPFFITSCSHAPFFGGALMLSLLLTCFFMFSTLISVWCFFAALLSVFIYGMLRVEFS